VKRTTKLLSIQFAVIKLLELMSANIGAGMNFAIQVDQQDFMHAYVYPHHLARRKFIQTRHFNEVFVCQRLSSFSLVPNPKGAERPLESPR